MRKHSLSNLERDNRQDYTSARHYQMMEGWPEEVALDNRL